MPGTGRPRRPLARWWPGLAATVHRGAGWTASALLLAVAAVHLDLYEGAGYRFVPTIGWLFLLTAAVAVVLALALAVRPLAVVVAAAGLFSLGVLGGYVLSLTLPAGIFGFRETGVTAAGYVAVVAESGTAIVAAVTTWRCRPGRATAGGRRGRVAFSPGWPSPPGRGPG